MLNKKKKYILRIFAACVTAALVFTLLPGILPGVSAAEEEVTEDTALTEPLTDSDMEPLTEELADLSLTDGCYYTDISLWKENLPELSAFDYIFQYNRKALITVENGKPVAIGLAFNPVSLDGQDEIAFNGKDKKQAAESVETAVAELTIAGQTVTAKLPEQDGEESVNDPEVSLITVLPEKIEEACLVKVAAPLSESDFQPAVSGEEPGIKTDVFLPLQLMFAGAKQSYEARLRFSLYNMEKTADTELTADTHMADASAEPFLSTDRTAVKLVPGKKISLHAFVDSKQEVLESEKAPSYQIRFESDNNKIASVNADGEITAVAKGTALIKVTASVKSASSDSEKTSAQNTAELVRTVKVMVEDPDQATLQKEEDDGLVLQEEDDDLSLQEEGDEDLYDDEEDDEDLSLQEEDEEDDLYDIGDEIVELEDERTGILFQYQEGSINPEPDDLEVLVINITSGSVYDTVAGAAETQGKKFSVYNIRLTGGVVPSSRFLIYVPVPDGWDGTRMIAYQIGDNGTLTALAGDLLDGYLVFSAETTGNFAIVEDTVVHNEADDEDYDDEDEEDTDDETTTPVYQQYPTTTTPITTTQSRAEIKTGDQANITVWIIIAAAAAAAAVIVLVLFGRKQRKNN